MGCLVCFKALTNSLGDGPDLAVFGYTQIGETKS